MTTSQFPNVARLYPNSTITRIKSFYIPQSDNHGLTVKIFSDKIIHGWNSNLLSDEDRIIQQLEVCINMQATQVQLEITDDATGYKSYPDYLISELITK